MTVLTIDDRILPSSGLRLAVVRQESVEQQAASRPEAKAMMEERVQKSASPHDKGQWRVLRYL